MRYSVISKGMTSVQLEIELEKAGARNIRKTRLLGQLFCELDEAQAEQLSRVSGLKIKPVKEYRTDQVMTEAPPVETISDVFCLIRSYFSPPLTGTGLTVAVLDTGIRKTHQSLKGKVVSDVWTSGLMRPPQNGAQRRHNGEASRYRDRWRRAG